MKYQIFNEDCLNILPEMEDESVDLFITSPPYCIGKAYDTHTTIDGFLEINEPVLREAFRITKKTGSICWQIGHHISKGEVIPLDFLIYELVKKIYPDAKLRNRIIWHFEHGANCKKRFSGRHETILWFTKSDDYYFDLDSIRVPQKYPGKKHYQGQKKGQYSCNPLGKNPGDIWNIPNVKSNHIEKTAHPCQFPVSLSQRLIKSLVPEGGTVLDPFMGSGTSGATALMEKRDFIGVELDENYYKIAEDRIQLALENCLPYRDILQPVFDPRKAGAVGRPPLKEEA